MKNQSVLLSCRILAAVFAAFSSSVLKSETQKSEPDISAHQLQNDTSTVYYRGEALLFDTQPDMQLSLRSLAEKCQNEKVNLCQGATIDKISIDDVIRQRNEEQCGAVSGWEKAIHTTCRYTIHAPLNLVGSGIRITGNALESSSEKLPWGLRHLVKMGGSLVAGIGGVTSTINDTLTLHLPTTLIGRVPTDPVESVADVPLQMMETSVALTRHTANVVHTFVQEPICMITEPVSALGDKTDMSALSDMTKTRFVSGSCLASVFNIPILFGDSWIAINKDILSHFNIKTPWRKTGDLRFRLIEQDMMPDSNQFAQAYKSCVQKKLACSARPQNGQKQIKLSKTESMEKSRVISQACYATPSMHSYHQKINE